MKMQLKSDKYRKARGGYSRFLNIFCAYCGTKLFAYQKDGPGPLKRLYLDRIVPTDISMHSKNLFAKGANLFWAFPTSIPKSIEEPTVYSSEPLIKKIVKA